MKIECEIYSVTSTGDSLHIKMQGKPTNSAWWRRLETQEITIPDDKKSQKALYIGRKVLITINPR